MKKTIILIILLTVCSLAYATREIYTFGDTGKTSYYCRVVKGSGFDANNFNVWSTAASAYQKAPTWANSKITLLEDANTIGLYYANMPSSIAGRYNILFYDNATAVSTDPILSTYDMYWSGTAEITPSSLQTKITDANSAILTIINQIFNTFPPRR